LIETRNREVNAVNYKDIQRVGDRHAASIRRAFIDRIVGTVAKTNWQTVEEMIPRGEWAVYNSIQWEQWRPANQVFSSYIEMYNKGLKMCQKEAVKKADFGVVVDEESFKMPNPQAEQWLLTFAAEEVRSITKTDRLLIRDILASGQKSGESIKATARRIKDTIGLTPNQAKSYNNYVNKLKASGVQEAQINKLGIKYRSKLLKTRAETIAITESHTATSRAWSDSVKDAVKDGTITDAEFNYVWWTAPDERRCPICGALHNYKTSVTKPEWPQGEPPVHPRCRCVTIIRRK
jgi:SPP1 gp7 family putative phage head morphogenesis protein